MTQINYMTFRSTVDNDLVLSQPPLPDAYTVNDRVISFVGVANNHVGFTANQQDPIQADHDEFLVTAGSGFLMNESNRAEQRFSYKINGSSDIRKSLYLNYNRHFNEGNHSGPSPNLFVLRQPWDLSINMCAFYEQVLLRFGNYNPGDSLTFDSIPIVTCTMSGADDLFLSEDVERGRFYYIELPHTDGFSVGSNPSLSLQIHYPTLGNVFSGVSTVDIPSNLDGNDNLVGRVGDTVNGRYILVKSGGGTTADNVLSSFQATPHLNDELNIYKVVAGISDDDGGGLIIDTNTVALQQKLMQGLKLQLGSCVYDLTAGFAWDRLHGSTNPVAYYTRIRNWLLKQPHVQSVQSLDIEFDEPQRGIAVDFTVVTDLGEPVTVTFNTAE